MASYSPNEPGGVRCPGCSQLLEHGIHSPDCAPTTKPEAPSVPEGMRERALSFHYARWKTTEPVKLLTDFAQSEVTRTLNQLREGVSGLKPTAGGPVAFRRSVLALIDKAKP